MSLKAIKRRGGVIVQNAVEKLIYFLQWYFDISDTESRARYCEKKAASEHTAAHSFSGTYVLNFQTSSEVIRKRRDVVVNIPQPSW